MLSAPMHPLFGFEAREHTAQVDPDNREIREKRFRFGERERDELATDEKRLREVGEANRFLPVLFCSPTMELGVDIAALNAVHMRNVPPTPANYAQRGGRAGRSGQAALVITYASSQSPHDQYFFRDPKAMVHGEVRAPILELANRDLIDSHLQAVWLSCVDQALDQCIAELLVLSDAGRPIEPDLEAALKDKRVAEGAGERIRRVLDLVADDLTPELAPWYTSRDLYSDAVVAAAPARFNAAFDRWRDLFAAAEEQRDAARRTMDDYSASYRDKRAAQIRHAQAVDQINLLQRGTSSFSSDFYTYRYLATEGFLPGYNFPRLPLLAYIPASRDGRGRQTYLQRPRFLALAEFGPRSLVYHEGRAYRVVRALLSLGHRESATPDARLPTRAVRICTSCGAGHFGDDLSMCHACGEPLGNAEVIGNTYRIENVATYPAEHITANDEERQRQGFELQTTFEWAIRDREVDVRHVSVSDADGEIVQMAYGPGATITRLNKGLRRRADKKVLGFRIDPVSGYWARNEEEEADEQTSDPTASPRQWIVPSVQDRKNALLFRPVDDSLSEVTLTTVQHAILRGVEAVFQLEEGEMLAEPMPTRDTRNGFLLYEATEGGAGVLTRLVSQEESLAAVARRALHIMHFAEGDDSLPESPTDLSDQAEAPCVAACYRCLMSYYNQPDHENLDRRDEDARAMLLRLARARTVPRRARSQPVGVALSQRHGRRVSSRPPYPVNVRSPQRIGRESVARGSNAARNSRTGSESARGGRALRALHLAPALRSRTHRRGRPPGPSADGGPRIRGHSLRGPQELERCLRATGLRFGARVVSDLLYAPGSLVSARGRDWVVLGGSSAETLWVRPVTGSDEDRTLIHIPLEIEPVREARFPLPSAHQLGGHDSALLLRDALLLSLRRGAGPFRSFGQISVEPRAYQLVPLLMALKLDPVRLLIADDVGVGKTIEALLIARELLDRGDIERSVVLCPPHLVDQWTTEMELRFHIRAAAVTARSARRLERGVPPGVSIFSVHPHTVVSLDYVKTSERRDNFLQACPNFVIVDEAHTCASSGRGRHQRHELLKGLGEQRIATPRPAHRDSAQRR